VSGSGISWAYANLHLTQTDNHIGIPPLNFFQLRCPSCCPTNSVKALKASRAKLIQAALLNRLTHYFALFWGMGLHLGYLDTASAKSVVIFLLDDPYFL